jgi:hypothetical protein
MCVDIGLNTQEDMHQLVQILAVVGRMADLCDKLPNDPALLDQPASDLKRLIGALPEPQVDPRLTIFQGLGLARGTLGLVRNIFLDNSPAIAPSVLPVLLRSALLGAGRVLYMLGPEDEAERIANTIVVLKQEADSYYRAYTQFADFERFQALIPPAETIAAYERRRADLMRGGRPPGEAKTLDSMAEVIGRMLAQTDSAVPNQELDNLATVIREHVRWMFNIYSGVAHGLAWPWLVPHTESLPGHFIAEFTTAANVAHLAADITLRRAGIV